MKGEGSSRGLEKLEKSPRGGILPQAHGREVEEEGREGSLFLVKREAESCFPLGKVTHYMRGDDNSQEF